MPYRDNDPYSELSEDLMKDPDYTPTLEAMEKWPEHLHIHKEKFLEMAEDVKEGINPREDLFPNGDLSILNLFD